MRLSVRHTTRYDYSTESRYAVQRLRLTPRDNRAQSVLDWAIDAPGIEAAPSYIDGFGNLVHLLAHVEAYDSITITASGTVETTESGGVLGQLDEAVNPILFLRPTRLTASSDGISALAREIGASDGGGDPIALLHGLLAAIEERVVYETDTTDAGTSAAAAFAAGYGVCQDHAHIFIAAARALGIPARYVTGYLHVTQDGPQTANHAWAEANIRDLGWTGFDPANRVCPTAHYVRIACGFDANSAAPVTGTRRGGGDESLEVDVVVEQQQQ